MPVDIHQFMCLSDNFGVLVHDPATGATATVDAPEAAPILQALKNKGWRLTDILITHHHADHTQGIAGLKAQFPEARVVGPAAEADKIGALDTAVREGDVVRVGSLSAAVIETPGHTAGHIVYWFEDEGVLFAADTLFALGCGRVFETPPATMYRSLQKLAKLPAGTAVYCGHEYTASNARFAVTVDPGNAALKKRAAEIQALRAENRPTLPTTIGLELGTNPFLRADDPAIGATLGMTGAEPAAVFAELRERKNKA